MKKIINRIDKLFSQPRDQPILSIFYTAGFPHLDDTIKLAKAVQDSGADMIEIGIPFSDPIADGPTIQESSHIALGNGMNVSILMSQLEYLRQNVDIPVLLMGYLNPILQFGLVRFLKSCHECGIDGLIIPDLPFDLYERKYKSDFIDNDLHYIALISPNTSEDRIRKIDHVGSGFIYAVSSASTTGGQNKITATEDYLSHLKELNLNNPILVGFNIKSYSDLQFVGRYHAGGIIGSAFINAIKNQENVESAAQRYISQIKHK